MEEQTQKPEQILSANSGEENKEIAENEELSSQGTPAAKGSVPPGGRRLNKWIIPLVALALAGLLGGWFWQQQAKPETETGNQAVAVEVFAVKKGDIRQISWFTGKVAPKMEIELLPQISGRIEDVYVETGDHVSSGDPLFKIDDQDILSQVRQLEASIVVAQAGKEQARLECVRSEAVLRQAQEAAVMANNNMERGEFLLAQGAISQAEFEGNFKTPAVNAKAGLKQSQALYDQACDRLKNSVPAQIAQAEAALAAARLNLERTLVKAPIAGEITARCADQGDLASPAQALASLIDISEVKVTIQVTGGEINKIQKDQAVELNIEDAGDKPWTGKVKAIAPAAGVRTGLYQVDIILLNKEQLLKPGMFARVELVTGLHEDVVCLPAAALLQKGGQSYVYKVEDGCAVRCDVSTAFTDGEYLEVTKGLQPGDQVVVSGQEFLISGSKVDVKKGDAAA